jgi:hypothetical protein
MDDIYATLDDGALQRMTARAWREAARSWQEYRSADAERQRLGGSTAPDDARWLAQTLHDAAWSAEHAWRAAYDACKARGIAGDA